MKSGILPQICIIGIIDIGLDLGKTKKQLSGSLSQVRARWGGGACVTHGRPPGRTMREKRRSRVPQAIRAHTSGAAATATTNLRAGRGSELVLAVHRAKA